LPGVLPFTVRLKESRVFATPHRKLLLAILIVYLLLGAIYSVTTPIFETPDEMWHYALVQHLSTNGLALPVLDAANVGPWQQEGGQPPLYYYLAALGTLHIDTADFGVVRQENPHVDLGIIPPDGNINVVVHDPAREAFPWGGAVLAVHVARFLSVLMGAVTVLTTYLIGREVFPEWSSVALGAAALNAFLPMFLFISGSVNNDNLSNMVAGLLIWQIVRLINPDSSPGYRDYVLIGLTAGAALLAKMSLGFLLPLVALALLLCSMRTRDWRPLVIGGLVSGGLTILLAGWWYLRNWQLYGDPTGLDVFLDIIGRRAVPADLIQLWSERESILHSWWGLFGSMAVPLPDLLYGVLNVLGGLSVLGFAGYLVARILRRVGPDRRGEVWGLIVISVWPLVAFGALLQWTSVTWASQGRLLYIAIGPISLWLAVGLMWWLPRRIGQVVLAVVCGVFLLVAVLAPFAVIQPAYALPDLDQSLPVDLPGVTQDFYEPGADAPALRLAGYDLAAEAVQPGDSLAVTLHWETLQSPSRRWSLFVHVLDSAGVIVAQRDRYPARGLLATERLTPGQAWSEPLVVDLPDWAYTPDTLTVALGLYDRATGERMLLAPESESRLMLAPPVALEPVDGDGIPNARADNFADLIALRGYTVDARQIAPGDDLQITLYWSAVAMIEQDYTVFVHVIDTSDWTIYGGSDAQPAAWTRPTSTWAVGEIVEDAHTFTLNLETPPGVYQLEVGLYSMPEAGVFERLNVIAEQGGQLADVVYLSRIAVGR
jgi:4-amino-4-deoxy-L-arabinose transferase-like glycosyltransferase